MRSDKMVRFTLILSLSFIYILQAFVKSDLLEVIFTLVAVALFLTMLPLLEIKGRIFTLTLFFLGMIIHFAVGDTGIGLVEGITQNMALLAIIILAPLLSIPLKREGIIETVVSYLNEMKNNPQKIYLGITTFMLALSPVLNMGALRIVHGFVENIKIPSKFLSRSYFVGFTHANIWSPFFASVGIVLYYMEMTYLSYVMAGVAFAILQIAVGVFLFRPRNLEVFNEVAVSAEVYDHTVRKKDLTKLLIFVFGLVLLLIVLEQIFKISMLLLVTIICVVVPILWVFLSRKTDIVKEEMYLYKDKLLTQSKTEICMFLSAGLFGNAISHTPVKDFIEQIMQWSATQSVGILFLFILLFVTVMAFMGVHQIVVIPLILISLNFAEIEISQVTIAFMCMFSWMLAAAISPLNALNIIVSQCVKKDGLTVAFRWNGKYFLAVTIIAFIYVFILDWTILLF